MARLGGRPGPQCRRWRSGCQASVSFVTMLGSCTPVVTYCSSAASTPAPCHTRGSLLGSSFSSIECRTVGPNTPVHRGRKVDMLQLLTHRFVSFFWEGVTSVKQLCPWSSNAIGRNARGVEFFMGHRQATWKSGVPVLMAWFGGEHEHRTRLTCRIFLVWNWGKSQVSAQSFGFQHFLKVPPCFFALPRWIGSRFTRTFIFHLFAFRNGKVPCVSVVSGMLPCWRSFWCCWAVHRVAGSASPFRRDRRDRVAGEAGDGGGDLQMDMTLWPRKCQVHLAAAVAFN